MEGDFNLNNKQNLTTPDIKTTKLVYPQIYSYILPDIEANKGSQKIGYTERENVDDRIREQTHTAALQLNYRKLWSAPSFFANSNKDFNDRTFHKFLIKNGIENQKNLGSEWFYFNGFPERSKELFDIFREKGFTALQNNNNKIPYTLRTEQENAVSSAKKYFEENENGEFLWNAKPRFGKTLSAYDLAVQLNAKKVLIVTNRPAIANSWFDDFEKFISDYYFISETDSLKNKKTITRSQFNSLQDIDKKQITFLSLQDLKGSKYFGGDYNKLEWIANLEWDLLIVDEAHEAIDTTRTDVAFDNIKRKYTLHLSGTPFKALANNKFPQEAIFNWTYLDEQKIKQLEIKESETGDHTDLPDLKLYTYRISQMTASEINKGIDVEGENHDFAFDLNEFFSTENQKFIYENDVRAFLENLTANTKYPFSTPELREELKHTFWYVGNRVDSVKALEQLLKQNEIFKDYKIIVAAGDGKSFDEESQDYSGNEKSFDKVIKAIKENDKTITLSCGQLTTGVTIKEWSAVLMLTDIKSPAQYMQAAFRAQNPHKFFENNELKMKKTSYLFDFAPIRVLKTYDQFANGLNPKAVDGGITEKERKENIKELLNFFPVISEDTAGRMVELDAEKVLTFPNALAASEIVKARFMSNLLFSDNIKNVFHIPKEAEAILNKLPNEKNKRVEPSKKDLDLDKAREIKKEKETKINDNTDIILGKKIYRSHIEDIIDNIVNTETPEEIIESLPNKAMSIAEPVIAKYKETYKPTNAEVSEVEEKIEEKIKMAAAEYANQETKDPIALKEKLIEAIELNIEDKVEQKESAKVETARKTKEEEIRSHLRAFARTIPMFIMANPARENITIDNFDEQISDTDFLDLTNITKDEFHILRDGFDYTTEDGQRETFGGMFDRYRFNASIAEFMAEKEKRSNYFTTDDDIFELIPNQKNNQIFTPKNVVKMMIDNLETETPELFTRTDSTFIDLYMKSGLYITEIVKKLFKNTRYQYSNDSDCLRHILENQVYGLAPTNILHNITNTFIFGFDYKHQISTKNFIEHDLIPDTKNGTTKETIAKLYNKEMNMMKFDAVVGNPPYQEMVGKSETQTQGNSNWIYYYFQDIADKIANKTSLIYPFGGWFDSPERLGGFGKRILSDKHTVSIRAYEGTSDKRAWYRTDKQPMPIFGNDANLSAGVSIVTRDHADEHETFEYSNRMYTDTQVTVHTSQWGSLAPNPDFLRWTNLKGNKLNKRVKKGIFGIESDFAEKNPTKVSFNKDDWQNPIQLLTNNISGSAGRATMFWTDRSTIQKGNEYIDLYKVVITSAYPKKTFVSGKPTLSNVKNRAKKLIEILPKGSAFGRSKLSLFMSDLEQDCLNFVKYSQTNFFAFLLLQEPNRSSSFGDVILDQDFSNNSDIDWSKSVAEIDDQLYRKYNLTAADIALLEETA